MVIFSNSTKLLLEKDKFTTIDWRQIEDKQVDEFVEPEIDAEYEFNGTLSRVPYQLVQKIHFWADNDQL